MTMNTNGFWEKAVRTNRIATKMNEKSLKNLDALISLMYNENITISGEVCFMKKTLMVSAIAFAFALGLTAPLGTSVYAACAGICTNSVEVGKERLIALVNAVRQQVLNEDDANYIKWRSANSAIEQIENKTGDSSVTALKDAVESAGGDVSGWETKTLPEMVAIAESVDGYDTNDDLKAKVASVQSTIDYAIGTLKDYLATPDSTLSAAELIAQVEGTAAFTKYAALHEAWQNAASIIAASASTSPSMNDLSTAYDGLYNAAFDVKNNLDLSSVDAVLGGTTSPGESAGGDQNSTSTSNEDLQALVDRYRADETFLKYEALVIAVDEAQMVLESLPEAQDMQVRALSSGSEEIAVAIAQIGDAMRNLGVNTTLGESITDPTAEDLRNAIDEAKGVADYAKYEELVRSIWEAELALKNGTDADALSKLLNKVQKAVANLIAPETGARPNTKGEGTAKIAGSFVGTAIIATLIGAGFVAKRQIERTNEQKSQL